MKIFKFNKAHLSSCRESLKTTFGFTNGLNIPKMEKIIVSITTKDMITDSKTIDRVYEDLFLITGQKPVITKAKISVAAFKLRKGMPIGVKVTLRRVMMYDFLRKFINVALPRVRDFKGFSKRQFDGNGNFSLGIKEQIIFPEIDYNRVDKIRGLGIVLVTTTNVDAESKCLLQLLGLPFSN
jgi:large subunit ribosomal protein L5